MRGVNLIPRYRIESIQRARRIRAWGGVGAAYAVAMVGAWAAAQFIWPDRRLAVADDIAVLQEQMHDDQVAARSLHPLLVQAQSTLAATQDIGDQPDWSYLTTLMANMLGDDAVLRSCSFQPAPLPRPADAEAAPPTRIERFRVQLEGYGRSQAAVLGYVRLLEEAGLFEAVTVLETRGEAFHDGQAIAFRIECILADGPPGGKP